MKFAFNTDVIQIYEQTFNRKLYLELTQIEQISDIQTQKIEISVL